MGKRCILVFIIILMSGSMAANNARFSGMGNLSLIFPDDFNRLDLYDFAKISAGFFRNDTCSNVVLRLSGLRETWEKDSITYLAIGQALPERLIDYAPLEAVAFYRVIPQFSLVPGEIVYRSRSIEETYDLFGNKVSPKSWGVYAGYSQLGRSFEDTGESDCVRTPSLSLIYSKPVSQNLDLGISADGFYGYYDFPASDEKVTLMPFGGGGGISYNSDILTLGLNTEYHYPMFTYDGSVGSENFSGHAVSPAFGSLIKFTHITWVGAIDYKWVSLNGSADGNDIGDLKITGYSAKTQILYAPSYVRCGAFVGYDNKTPTYTDANGSIWFETAYKHYTFGGGMGVLFDRVLFGIEGIYGHFIADDKSANNVLRSNDINIRCGSELSFINNLFIRVGYDYGRLDPDLDDIIDVTDCHVTHVITGGLGINLLKNTEIDCGYNYKHTFTNYDPQIIVEETITDHILFLYVKHTIRKEEF